MKTYEAYAGNGTAASVKDPARVQHDVQDIMSEMGETLQAIQERFSPGEMLDQFLRGIRGFGRGSGVFATNLGRSVRENPLPAALIGGGIGALLLSARRSRRSEPAVGEYEDIGEYEAEPGVRERAREAGGEVAHRTREGMERTRDWVRDTWYEQPVVVGALCLAFGAILGGSLPLSRKEREVLGPAREKAKERIAQATQATLERAQEKLGGSAGEGSSAGSEGGTPAGTLRSRADEG
jgi:hypothetical protein